MRAGVSSANKARAEADDAYGLAKEQVILGFGETSAPVVIEAHPAFMVTGTVVVAGGGGCDAGGSIGLVDPAQGRQDYGALDPDGTVQVRGLLSGEYTVHVRCEGMLSAVTYPPVIVSGASVTGLRWEVTRGQAIRGVVVDGRGQPASRVSLYAQGQADPAQPRVSLLTAGLTFADGGKALVLGNGIGLIPSIPVPHRIHVWDVRTGALLRQIDTEGGAPYSLDVSPDGNTLAATTADDGVSLRTWGLGKADGPAPR